MNMEFILPYNTGLKDKNGNYICEGDVVEGTWIDRDNEVFSKFTVKYDGGGFWPFSEPTGQSSGFLYHTEILPKNFEIIERELCGFSKL